LFLHKTFKALNGLLFADVPLRNYSLTPTKDLVTRSAWLTSKSRCCHLLKVSTSLLTIDSASTQHLYKWAIAISVCKSATAISSILQLAYVLPN